MGGLDSMDTDSRPDFSNLSALFINTTLTRSPDVSHTQRLIDSSASIMAKQGVRVDQFRSVDHAIASGVYPDMREHGWSQDEWPALFERVMAADVLVIAGPIWLGDNSSETKKVIERLYAHSGELNEKGQWLFYGKIGGCLITGNEDGIKHCASNVLYSLQHIGYSIAPPPSLPGTSSISPACSRPLVASLRTAISVENGMPGRGSISRIPSIGPERLWIKYSLSSGHIDAMRVTR